MKYIQYIRTWIQRFLFCSCLAIPSIGYGIEIQYIPNDWARFVYYLSQDRSLIHLVPKLDFRQYSFPEGLLQQQDAAITLEEEQFFSSLAALKAIDEIETVLDSIEDVTQRQAISQHINKAYQAYRKLNVATTGQGKLASYTQAANQWVAQQAGSLNHFFEQVATFYNLAFPPYKGEITVYPYLATLPHIEQKLVAFYNVVLLPITHLNSIEEDGQSLLLTLLQLWYEKKAESLQKCMNLFFAAYSSPYSYFARAYLDQALRQALQHIYFAHHLQRTNHACIPNTDYVERFAHAIESNVASYLANRKKLDLSFCKAAVDHFGRTFPQIIYDIDKVLERCLLMLKQFDKTKVLETIKKHIHIHNAFSQPPMYPTAQFIEEIKKSAYAADYDDHMPIIAVVTLDEIKHRAQFLKDYPLFKKLKRSFLKIIGQQKGLYILRTSAHRMYLFFVVGQYEELDQLSRRLQERKQFAQEAVMSIMVAPP